MVWWFIGFRAPWGGGGLGFLPLATTVVPLFWWFLLVQRTRAMRPRSLPLRQTPFCGSGLGPISGLNGSRPIRLRQRARGFGGFRPMGVRHVTHARCCTNRSAWTRICDAHGEPSYKGWGCGALLWPLRTPQSHLNRWIGSESGSGIGSSKRE